MKEKNIQRVGIILVLVIAALLAVFTKKYMVGTKILTADSPDKSYQVEISHTDFPGLGSDKSACSLKLKKGSKEICNKDAVLNNGGADPDSSNFEIEWQDDHVSVTVTVPGVEENTYKLYFNGDVK